MSPVDLLNDAYDPLLHLAEVVDDDQGWIPTLLPGWTVRDLLFHLAADCQRALVALSTPSLKPADTDEISYWSEWKPGSDIAQANLRATRTVASAWPSVRGPADLYLETARAVLYAAERAESQDVVVTQNRRLTVGAMLHTLAVEATVHHLDLQPALPSRPQPSALAGVRQVLDGLLGQPAPAEWDDIRYIRVGTGRMQPNVQERAWLGELADRLPLFG